MMPRNPKYDDWDSESFDNGERISVDVTENDDGLIDILIELHVQKSYWNDFNKYCRRYGHGGAKNAIIMTVRKIILKHGTDYNLDDNKTKVYFSPHFKTWAERLSVYLVFAHFTIILLSYLNYLISGSINYYGYISGFIYVMSLVIALFSWLVVGFRNSMLGDKDSLESAQERKFFIWAGRNFWLFWTTSALLLLAGTFFRFVSFVLTVKAPPI